MEAFTFAGAPFFISVNIDLLVKPFVFFSVYFFCPACRLAQEPSGRGLPESWHHISMAAIMLERKQVTDASRKALRGIGERKGSGRSH